MPRVAERGRERRWAAGPLLGLLAIAGICTAAIPAQGVLSDRPRAAAVRPLAVDTADRAAADRLTSARSAALTARDRKLTGRNSSHSFNADAALCLRITY